MNIYVPKARTLTFLNKTLLKVKAHIEPDTIIVGDFHRHIMETETKQRHSKTNRSYEPNGFNDEPNGFNLQNISP